MQESIQVVNVQSGYDKWSAIYDDYANPLIAVEQPVFDRLLGDVSGMNLIDVGCGTGRHANTLATRGAQVTAVDFSKGMLSQAQQKPGGDQVNFVEHDLATPLPFDDGSFDVVICALVLDHIHKLEFFFGELARVCKSDGLVLITVMHPAMMLKGVQARFKDPHAEGKIHIDSAPNEICDYVNAVLSAGLRIDAMEEHRVPREVVDRMPNAEKYLDWPILLAMKLSHQNA